MAEDTIYYTTNTWNLARSIASEAVDITEKEVETPEDTVVLKDLLSEIYADHESERDVWPFDGMMDLLRLVDEHIGLSSDTRPINDLAKVVSTRIQDDPQYEYRHEPAESDTDSSSESESESESDQPSDVDKDADVGAEAEPESEGELEAEPEAEVDADPESESENEQETEAEAEAEAAKRKRVSVDVKPGDVLTPDGIKSDADPILDDQGDSESKGTGTDKNGDTAGDTTVDTDDSSDEQSEVVANHPNSEAVREVAERLYGCFVAHDGQQTYREVQAEYASSFPRRSVALTQVANSTGATKPDRVDSIAAWVAMWFGSDQQVTEENRYAREPMGKSV